MSYVAEIFVIDGALTAQMKEIPEWLNHERFEPESFHYVQQDDGILLRVDFRAKTQATAFAQKFGGRVLDPQ